MKRFLDIQKRITTAITAVAALFGVSLSQGCSTIFESEEDCSVRYLVEFRFTNNIMETDAFASKVTSVALFVYDTNGNLVATRTESGSALQREHYMMEIDVQPGTYDLVAWCGLENNGEFSLPAGPNPATLDQAVCLMAREYAEEPDGAVSQKPLTPLYHAMNTNVVFPESEGPIFGDVVVSVMDLIKDTNTIRIILTHYNGKAIDPEDFSFSISDDNGKMNFDNSLMTDEMITYREWTKKEMPSVDTDTKAVNVINSMIAEIDIARLVTTHNPFLTIQARDKSEPVLSLPITNLLLYAKGEARSSMSDQRYLDCQDEYNLVFFIDDENGWYRNAGIYINGWHLMNQGAEI